MIPDITQTGDFWPREFGMFVFMQPYLKPAVTNPGTGALPAGTLPG